MIWESSPPPPPTKKVPLPSSSKTLMLAPLIQNILIFFLKSFNFNRTISDLREDAVRYGSGSLAYCNNCKVTWFIASFVIRKNKIRSYFLIYSNFKTDKTCYMFCKNCLMYLYIILLCTFWKFCYRPSTRDKPIMSCLNQSAFSTWLLKADRTFNSELFFSENSEKKIRIGKFLWPHLESALWYFSQDSIFP